jgi:uncharacterized damage-inducible protein DinB
LFSLDGLNFRGGAKPFIMPGMTGSHSAIQITASLNEFRRYKSLGERAMAQIQDDQLQVALDPESNSIAVIVKHMAGNMRSRWMDFLTTDGEKPDRHRDSEFESPPATRAELMRRWESGWDYVFRAVEPLADADLARTIYIRTEPYSVGEAIQRQIAHYAYHVGQIVFLAKHFQSARWNSLSIPRGKSRDFDLKVARGQASQKKAQ